MSIFLHIETATAKCSAALSRDKELLGIKSSSDDRSAASMLAVFCDQLLKENQMGIANLDAVVVSKGPGSYTGLRIGVATAKGLCYASGKPLIAVNTLQAMAVHYAMLNKPAPGTLIIPMIDARRDEVYTAVFNAEGMIMSPVTAMILTGESFVEYASANAVCIGDGAMKASAIIRYKDFTFDAHFRHSAEGMTGPAVEAFQKKQFEDIAYFEPYYLKEFAGSIPKRMRS